MGFWDGKTVMVTGGSGFLGSHVVELLEQKGCTVAAPRSKAFDFKVLEQCNQCMEQCKPDIVIHGAAYYGGIWINRVEPGRIYYENLVMGANVMEAARLAKVEKFVTIGTACSYPGEVEGLMRECDWWKGLPHESVVNYGMVKKMLAIQGMAYKKEYDFDSLHLILTNLYGPRDCYNPKRSHVAAALIRKFVEAEMQNAESVEVWGTGKPIREFLYVKDCAEAIIRAAEAYNDLEPMNIGTGIGTSVKELAEMLQELSGFKGKITWNTEKPDGQMKKVLDVSKMKQVLQWKPPTSLREGLKKTIQWYRENKEEADKRV